MALSSTRVDVRLELSNVDRQRDASERVVVACHPSEAAEHVTLRLLAYCLFHEDDLAFGPGLADAEGADLWTRDGAGRVTTWIECGSAPFEKLKKVAQHNPGAAVHALFADPRRREELVGAAREAGPRAAKVAEAITVWAIDGGLVTALAKNTERSRRWGVTIVGDHLYVEADGATLEGEVVRDRLADAMG
jgi:uncharacterized protein YaeQ